MNEGIEVVPIVLSLFLVQRASNRPETTPTVARRLIANGLGLQAQVSPEQKEKEAKQFEAARERKRQETQRKNGKKEAEEEEEEESSAWGDT